MKALSTQPNDEDENRLQAMPIFLRNRLLDAWQAEKDDAEFHAEERQYWRQLSQQEYYLNHPRPRI